MDAKPSVYTRAILDRLAKQACEILGIERAAIFVREEDTGAPVAVAGHGVSDELIRGRSHLGQGMVAQVLASGQPLLVDGSGSAPISWEGEVRGAIAAGTSAPGRAFGERELRSLCELAELGGLALEHAAMRRRLERVIEAGVEVLARAVDMRDSYTARHSEEMAALARDVGSRMGLAGRELIELEFAARLHDLGKIGVPDQILRKPGPLTRQEWEVMRHHPAWGAEMLASIPGLERVAEIVASHHERYDGGGYPEGLAGEHIPLGARIISTCDAYQAMVSNRPYRAALGAASALRELTGQSGGQFDPGTVEALRAAAGRFSRAGA